MIFSGWDSVLVGEADVVCNYFWDNMKLDHGRDTCFLEDPLRQVMYDISVTLELFELQPVPFWWW